MRTAIVILCALLCVFFTFGCVSNDNTPANTSTPTETPVTYTQTAAPSTTPVNTENPADSPTFPKPVVATTPEEKSISHPVNQSVLTERDRPTHNVTISGNTLNPAQISIASGDVVVWTNNDAAEHTLVSGVFNNTVAPNGGTERHIFIVPGTYNYVCTDQPSMKGTIIVT